MLVLEWPDIGRTGRRKKMPNPISRPARGRIRSQRLEARVTHQQIELSVRDSRAFVDALSNPKPVNDRLRETVRRYREATDV
jgi:Protein of unknown function (DUF1778)